MPKNKKGDKKDNELDKMNKDYQTKTGMRVIQKEEPPAGRTEFAKDKK